MSLRGSSVRLHGAPIPLPGRRLAPFALLCAIGLAIAAQARAAVDAPEAQDRYTTADVGAASEDPPSTNPTPFLQDQAQAWWTGPMLAASAETLPKGHLLFEPYFFDIHSQGKNQAGTLDYLLYGLTDRLSVGVIATAGDVVGHSGLARSQPELGDLTVLGQYRLTHFERRHPVPSVSLIVQETIPTGRFDRLGAGAASALGSGGFATTLGVYLQTYLWMPNGRILRPRLDLLETLPRRVDLRDISVFGTPQGFLGKATTQGAFVADGAVEYSLSQRWVLAFDFVYQQSGPVTVNGAVRQPDPAASQTYSALLGASRGLSLAPAVEYNLSGALGVLVGVRVTPAGHNTSSSVTPAIAINWVR